MWELSTPFMYLRWLMLKAGYGNTAPMQVVNVTFMLVFVGCRNVWGPGEALHLLLPWLPPNAGCCWTQERLLLGLDGPFAWLSSLL
jgi:hypothetical protein